MKTLLLAATILTATGVVAAPSVAPATQTAPVAGLSYDQLAQAAVKQFDAEDWPGL